MKFYDNKGSYSKNSTKLSQQSSHEDNSHDEMSSNNNSDFDVSSDCKRTKIYEPNAGNNVVTSTPIKSQIVMSSKEMPPSSDESETIEFGSEINHPFRDINVDDIPIEIVDDLLDTQYDVIDVKAFE